MDLISKHHFPLRKPPRDRRWEECTPVGVIQPVCSAGYAVTSEDVRKVLEICSDSNSAGHVGSENHPNEPLVSSNMARNPPRIWRFSSFFIYVFMCFHVKIICKWGSVQPRFN